MKRIFITLLAGCLLFSGCSNKSVEPQNKETNKETKMKMEIWKHVENKLADKLLSPSTANYSEYQDDLVKFEVEDKEGNKVYTVRIQVDAQNSFGAMIRKKYKIDVLVDKHGLISSGIFEEES